MRTFPKLSQSILCLSITLTSWKKQKICFPSSPSIVAVWLFTHLADRYALLIHSPHAAISFFVLLFPPPPFAFTPIPYPPAASLSSSARCSPAPCPSASSWCPRRPWPGRSGKRQIRRRHTPIQDSRRRRCRPSHVEGCRCHHPLPRAPCLHRPTL